MPAVRSRALKRAVEIVGGIEILALQLGVSRDDLVLWSQGITLVPEEVFLRAVDIVTAAEVNEISGKHRAVNDPDADEGKPR